MGKVGSSTIYRNLRAQLSLPVFHTHTLNRRRLDVMMSREPDPARREIRFNGPLSALEHLNGADRAGEPVRVITGVREPVGRNISAYFENLGPKSSWSVQQLMDDFLQNYHHNTPLEWFDLELREVFDVDVYAEPFDTARGWNVLETDGVEVLIIRMENLNQVLKEDVIQDFLGMPDVRFDGSFNRAEDKPYADVYGRFRKTIDLPDDYLAAMLDSSYCRHFYSDAERAGLYKRWRLSA